MSQHLLPMLHLPQESTKNWKFWEKPRTDVWQTEIRASVKLWPQTSTMGFVFAPPVTPLDWCMKSCQTDFTRRMTAGMLWFGFWLGRFEFKRWISWFTHAHSTLNSPFFESFLFTTFHSCRDLTQGQGLRSKTQKTAVCLNQNALLEKGNKKRSHGGYKTITKRCSLRSIQNS